MLSNTLSMELELEAREQSVGPYRADILCKDLLSQNWVVIENQLNKTDHNHLGQLLTYSAGLKTTTIIWIAESFSQEHRAALDWLNEVTSNEVQFFALEIELWKIGDSLPAPKFNAVCKPNYFLNQLKKISRTKTEEWQYKYWEEFKEYFKNKDIPFVPSSTSPAHCMTIRIEKSIQFNATVHTRENRIGVEVVIPDSKENFNVLESQKEQIEMKFGEHLEWQNNPITKVSRIVVYKHESDIWKKEDWHNQFEWLASKLEKFEEVFLPRIKELETIKRPFEDT